MEPVAALLEREETGYRELRKALVRVYSAQLTCCCLANVYLLRSEPQSWTVLPTTHLSDNALSSLHTTKRRLKIVR